MQARSIRTKTSTDLRTGRDVMVEGGIEELRAARTGEMDKFLIKKESGDGSCSRATPLLLHWLFFSAKQRQWWMDANHKVDAGGEGRSRTATSSSPMRSFPFRRDRNGYRQLLLLFLTASSPPLPHLRKKQAWQPYTSVFPSFVDVWTATTTVENQGGTGEPER
nr:hypothetical protein Iba_chr05eCG9460 [Ipomoea batatas]